MQRHPSLSALSLAGNVAQFVELGYKVARRLSEYHNANADEVPRSMQTINTLLPLVLESLDRIKSDAEIDKFDTNSRCMLKAVVAGCLKLCEDIEGILAKFTRTSGESVTLKVRKALGSLKHDGKLAEIGRSLQAYVQVLILYRVVDSKEVPSRSLDKVKYNNIRGKLAPGFVRRDDLVNKLDAALADVIAFQQKQPQKVVLNGPSGVGKTQLALDYCFEAHKAGRFQTAFWLATSSPIALRSSLEDVAATVRKSNDGSQDAKIDFVKDFLAERWHPWLLVLDGYAPAKFAGVDIWSLLPHKGCGGIIFTTSDSLRDGIQIRVNKAKQPDELKALQEQLGRAVKAKNLDEMISCIKNGADIHQKNSQGSHYSKYYMLEADHCITQAAVGEFVQGVKYLLEEGADPEPAQAEFSVMAMAGYRRSPQLLQVFLDFEDAQGTRSQQRSYEKALEIAADFGESDCARMLVERRGVKPGSCFYTPHVLWCRAANKGHVGTLKLLEESGLRPRDEDIWFESMKQAIWGKSIDAARYLMNFEPEQRKANAHRALCLAVDYNQIELVQTLLENGCDPNLPDSDGNMAILAAIKQDNEEIMRLLLNHGVLPVSTGNDGPSGYYRHRGHSARTAIMVLESMTPKTPHAREFFIMMIEKSVKDGGWELALATVEAAERLGHKETVLGHIIDDGCTPLAMAIGSYGDLQFARFFIKQGSDLDVRKTSNSDSIMHMAIRGGSTGIVQLLLEKTQEKFLSTENKYGNTPLHLAASKCNSKVMRLLLVYGADPEAENKFGVTPRDMALEENSDALEELLVEMEEWSTWSLAKKLQMVRVK